MVEVILSCCARGVGSQLADGMLVIVAPVLRHDAAAVRHLGARCLARAAVFDALKTIDVVIRHVLPLLEETRVCARLGAIEAVYRIIELVGDNLLPYAVFLVTPVLARMSDAHPAVRETATRCFATLLKVLPLEKGIPDPVGLSADLVAGRLRQRRFLEQLWDPTHLEPYTITANISASLRPYQLEGVNWLGFLVKYQLHGILCDDMGLGKTLQTIAVLGSDVVNRRLRHSVTHLDSDRALPSLVVCPTTLVQHWCHEIQKFCPELKAIAYTGTPHDRLHIIKSTKTRDDVLVISYEALRNDVQKFLGEGCAWNFAVLDEGHVVKNPKSKITIAVKLVGLCAKHRLILTGTPIQNNVLELWGLFDFLMPSFLGSQVCKGFTSIYQCT